MLSHSMVPPTRGLNLDITALSGICGSISIACWIVVFTPQILENFRRHSASGLSLLFIIAWLLGDVFNILGAILQGVLPTMTILAVYYTLADLVLLGQCFYYRGWTLSDYPAEEVEEEEEEERPLLWRDDPPASQRRNLSAADAERRPSRGSLGSFHEHLYAVDGTHLSPATPLRPASKATEIPPSHAVKSQSALIGTIYNTSALVLVCAAGFLGWWLSAAQHPHRSHEHQSTSVEKEVHFDLWGQIFGYLCAVLYLGSRLPQLLLNFRRKSTEGVSMLFFLFACVGNLTYVLSIFAYEPNCARLASVDDLRGCEQGEWSHEYGRYILVNTSWLIGSAGTLILDLMIFGQFWIYRGKTEAQS